VYVRTSRGHRHSIRERQPITPSPCSTTSASTRRQNGSTTSRIAPLCSAHETRDPFFGEPRFVIGLALALRLSTLRLVARRRALERLANFLLDLVDRHYRFRPFFRRFAVPIATAVPIANALDFDRPRRFNASAILSRFFRRAGVSFFADLRFAMPAPFYWTVARPANSIRQSQAIDTPAAR
jgi:hypothetical protein